MPLEGDVEFWLGETGTDDIERMTITSNAGVEGNSPYGAHALQGASIVPRCLFFVNETENPAIIRAPRTITVNPRRGSQDKRPWKDLDLAEITLQTIETAHVFDVHLGETLVPYATLEPLKAILPLKRGDSELPVNRRSPDSIRMGGLERRMRDRWQTVSRLWEENKARANRLSLLGQLNYYGKLSSQLAWLSGHDDNAIRVIYSGSGFPTAAIVEGNTAISDYTLFWIDCKSVDEANYLLAIINSDTLEKAVNPLMPKGQFGARHLQKHLWKLPIPEYDPTNPLHAHISHAGNSAAHSAARELAHLHQQRGNALTVTIARRELRAWLRASVEGKRVEEVVGALLAQRE